MAHALPYLIRRVARGVAFGAACPFLATGVRAQSSPNADTSRLTLPALHLESLAFDADRSRLVLFGGSSEFGGTWEWEGHRWRLAADSISSPLPRAGAPMAYDPGRHRVVMFGGQSRVAGRGPGLCDTWTFDGRRWERDNDAPCVTDKVINSSLVYDTRRRVMLLVDGTTIGRDTVTRPMRIWRWTRDAWQLVDSAGPRRVGFSNVAFDEARGVLVAPVLFGGPDAGVWEWDGRRWRHAPATGPATLQTYALIYDASIRRTILLGGQGSFRGPYLSDTWSWDGVRWAEVRENGIRPSGRGGATLLRDPRTGRLMYLNGYDERGPLPELWIRDEGGSRLWSGP